MNKLDRRLFLGLSAGGFAATSLRTAFGMTPVSFAAPNMGAKKILTIFLRGGNDATNSVIPISDPQYASARPSIGIPSGSILDLGNGWSGFHPSLAKLLEIHDDGQLASIHRVGYPNINLSHFSGQRFIETAQPGDYQADEGFVTRWAAEMGGGLDLPAVSVSQQIMRTFKGSPALPHIPNLASYTLGGDQASLKLMGTNPSGGASGTGLRGVFGSSAGSSSMRDLVNESSVVMADVLDQIENLPAHNPPADYYPKTDPDLAAQGLPEETYARNFFAELEDAVRLLKQTDTRICGVEMPLFDHHSKQGGEIGQHAEHLACLAHGMRSTRLDTLSDIWQDLLVVVISEFGRTSDENGSGGTDHGKGSLAFVAGGSVVGGVYNCDSTTWPANQTLYSDSGRYVSHLTDYRTVLAEVFERHMGAGQSQLNTILPGWSGFSGSEYDYLNFLI